MKLLITGIDREVRETAFHSSNEIILMDLSETNHYTIKFKIHDNDTVVSGEFETNYHNDDMSFEKAKEIVKEYLKEGE